MKRSYKSLAVAVLLGIGLGYAICRPLRTRAGSAELTELRQELSQLRQQVRSHEPKLQGADPAATAPAQAMPRSPEARAEDERRRQNFVARIAAEFRNEPQDPQWSAATAAIIQAALASSRDLQPLARGVECRSQTCRVEIADDRSGKLGKLLPMFVMRVGQTLPRMTADHVVDASGATTVVLYLSRRTETASAP